MMTMSLGSVADERMGGKGRRDLGREREREIAEALILVAVVCAWALIGSFLDNVHRGPGLGELIDGQ